jgi:glycosyltransferase involved in cell wall biosynthesis
MKILMTTETYYPSMGGIESHIQTLANSLSERGHEIIVCTVIQKGLLPREDQGKIKIYRLDGLFQNIPFLHRDPAKKTHPPAYDFLFSRGLGRIIEKEHPDILHAHDWTVYSALPLKRRFKLPVLLTIHGYHFVCPNKSLMRGFTICDHSSLGGCVNCMRRKSGLVRAAAAYLGVKVSQKALSGVDVFMPVSLATRDIHLKHLRLKEPRMVAISTPLEAASDEGNHLGIELPTDFILFVGGLYPQKGVDTLVEAYKKLKTEAKLVLIGYRHLDYQYHSSGNVIFIENVPRKTVLAAMSRCRFAVFPSILPEALGLVAIEAMSRKKAVIVTAVGGLKDVILDGRTGILVPANDPLSLSRAMQQLLNDPGLAQTMGERGYQRYLELFTPETIVPRIIQEYDRLLPGRS